MLISNSQIDSIDEDAFKGLSHLEQLVLQNCSLAAVPPIHEDAKSNITTLNLAHNLITHIPDDYFEVMEKLENVVLDGNYLKQMPMFDLIKDHVLSISLRENQLESLDGLCDNIYPKLRYMQMTSNRIKSLDLGRCLSKAWPGLFRVDLSNNKIVFISDIGRWTRVQPKSLVRVVLKENPFKVRKKIYLW